MAKAKVKDGREWDWLPKGAPKRKPKLRMAKVLWVAKGTSKHACQASIWEVDTGLELRVMHKGEIKETQLSRVGEGPLLERAEKLRQVLADGGWTIMPGGK